MINVTICDDEKIYIDMATDILKSTNADFDILTYSSGYDMLNNVPSTILSGIFIIDIELPDINGLEVAKNIRSKSSYAIIIFLTNYDDYVFDGYKVGALRYVRKEKMGEELLEALLKAIDLIEEVEAYIIVDVANTATKIYLSNIVYLEKYKKYVEIHLNNGEVVKNRCTLSDVMSMINHSYFIEIRKGVVVNAQHIKQLEGLKLVMDNNATHYISRNKIKDVKKKMLNCWRKHK